VSEPLDVSEPTGPNKPQDATAFHGEGRPVYDGELGWAVYKRADAMATVAYEASHANPDEAGDRRGHGRNIATWVFSEEASNAEGLMRSGIELVMDSRLAPGASVGLHVHDRTEEVYYLLEGELTITTVGADSREATATLRPGDAHLIRVGQAHFVVAGPSGARFMAIAARVP
jgi:quercetin dioxygenase-like cupin family protein